jgi:hypothetical protein
MQLIHGFSRQRVRVSHLEFVSRIAKIEAALFAEAAKHRSGHAGSRQII